MKHKIRIHKGERPTTWDKWYVICLDCHSEGIMGIMTPDPDTRMFGRSTWDAALAIGIAHQQNANGRGEHE